MSATKYDASVTLLPGAFTALFNLPKYINPRRFLGKIIFNDDNLNILARQRESRSNPSVAVCRNSERVLEAIARLELP